MTESVLKLKEFCIEREEMIKGKLFICELNSLNSENFTRLFLTYRLETSGYVLVAAAETQRSASAISNTDNTIAR